jgi:segregation and condensation protein A
MRLHLANFDGPLDLLLHLIKAHEVSVFNIPIVLITEQYLSFLRNVPDLDFNEAGEYLAMAAQLIEIKAAFLVPALQNTLADNPESLEDLSADDPRRSLVEQLIAYEAIKEACIELNKLKMLGRDVFPSGEAKRREGEVDESMQPIKGDPYELVIAFERVLLRFAQKRNAPKVTVHAQKITIESRMVKLKDFFRVVPAAQMTELFVDCESRYELIVVFMAVLELCKANQLQLEQHEHFGPITITHGPKFEEDAPEVDGPPRDPSALPPPKPERQPEASL